MNRTALAVLAGGEGRRMGGPKDLLTADGTPVLTRLMQRLAWPGPTILVTAHSGRLPPGHEAFDHVTSDEVPGQGPLRGILSAIRANAAECTVLAPLDMPGLAHEHVAWVAQELHRRSGCCALLLSRQVDGKSRVEPFPCAFRAAAEPMLLARLESGRRALHALADEPTVSVVAAPDWPGHIWLNVNSPEDLPAGWTRPGAPRTN